MCGVRPKFWEGGWIEMEKSKRTFRGSYPAYALTYFFFYWSLGVFTSVLSMYLTGIGKSKAEMSFIMSASSLFGVVLIPIVGYINDKLRKPQLREISDVKLRGIFRSRTRLCNLKRRARGRGSTGSRIFL